MSTSRAICAWRYETVEGGVSEAGTPGNAISVRDNRTRIRLCRETSTYGNILTARPAMSHVQIQTSRVAGTRTGVPYPGQHLAHRIAVRTRGEGSRWCLVCAHPRTLPLPARTQKAVRTGEHCAQVFPSILGLFMDMP